MFVVYTKEKEPKVLFDVNLTQDGVDKALGGDVYKAFPNMEVDKNNTIVMEVDSFFANPTYDEEKNTIREMTNYELFKKGKYALLPYEREHNGTIISLTEGQYITPEGTIATKPKIEGVKVVWDFETEEWKETATEYEMVEMQYKEYKPLDHPSILKEMEQIDPAMSEELVNLLIQSRQLMDSLSAGSGVSKTKFALINVSEKLRLFKEKRRDV